MAKATDRQRKLLGIIAELINSNAEFTVQEIVESPVNKSARRSFSSSHVNPMLVSLAEAGLTCRNQEREAPEKLCWLTLPHRSQMKDWFH
jgi:hypothetical protein